MLGRSVKFVLRTAISVAFLAFAYSMVNFRNLASVLQEMTAFAAVAITAVYVLGQGLSSYKWGCILSSAQIHRPLRNILSAYFLGMYVNTVGLGTVGGDVTRSLAIKPQRGERGVSLACVVADRIHGLTMLISVALFGMLFVRPENLNHLLLPVSLLFVMLAVTGWYIGPRLLTRIFPSGSRFGRIAEQIALGFPHDIGVILKISLVSVVFHLSQIFIFYLIALELRAPIPFSYLVVVVPFVNFATALPISFGGLGLRETLFVLFLTPLGISREVAVAFATIWVVCVTLVAVTAGVAVSHLFPEASPSALLNGEPPNADPKIDVTVAPSSKSSLSVNQS